MSGVEFMGFVPIVDGSVLGMELDDDPDCVRGRRLLHQKVSPYSARRGGGMLTLNRRSSSTEAEVIRLSSQ